MLKKLIPFIQRWEGGLSHDQNDRASKAPAPWTYNGKTGWHTNKGITFTTFQTHASKLGYKVSPENFFAMPNDLWLKILVNGYMAPWNINRLTHLPQIQAVIITWSWGSGVGGATTRLAKFLKDETGKNPKHAKRNYRNVAPKHQPAQRVAVVSQTLRPPTRRLQKDANMECTRQKLD